MKQEIRKSSLFFFVLSVVTVMLVVLTGIARATGT